MSGGSQIQRQNESLRQSELRRRPRLARRATGLPYGHSAALTDQDFYDEARALVDEGQFTEALDVLHLIKKQEQPRVLNYIGYTTRKLGDVDKGLDYYHQALALDPNYLRAREYLGEGYLQKGDLANARDQLMEIAERCGDACEEYGKLEKAIVTYVTEGGSADW
jgi:tetratricopeptide (TPR) repeat protein